MGRRTRHMSRPTFHLQRRHHDAQNLAAELGAEGTPARFAGAQRIPDDEVSFVTFDAATAGVAERDTNAPASTRGVIKRSSRTLISPTNHHKENQ